MKRVRRQDQELPSALSEAQRVNQDLKKRLQQRGLELTQANWRLNEEAKRRRQTEEIVRQLNAKLQQHAAERSAQIEATRQEMETLWCAVSHDFRAPLRHIESFANILNEMAAPSLNEEGRQLLGHIVESARKMSKLMEDLLGFVRLGRADLSKSKVNPVLMVREALQALTEETYGREVDWSIGRLEEVYGDPSMLRQVFMNLISNALKYTRPRKTARIEVGCSSKDTETVFFVRDNGVGFDPRNAGKLFLVFQRLHSAEEFEGTGIGLANVRRIIERHGGCAWANSELNAGATFYFSIPKTATGADAE